MMKTKKTLKETVVEGIYREIEEGIYKPNDIIHEGEIMEKYAMSKSPVREALIELCKDNVLKSIPRVGQEPQVPGNCPYRDWKQMPVIPLTNASCISCGLCAARCPVQAIPVSNPSSTDQSRCILCMRCISVCPVKARSLPEQACAMLEQKLSSVRDIRRENELFL